MEKQIRSITHLLDENGNILDLNEFNAKYNIDRSIEVYKKVTQNFPRILIQSIKNNILNMPTLSLRKIKIHYVNEKCNNTFLRQSLVNSLYPGRTRNTLIYHRYDKVEI